MKKLAFFVTILSIGLFIGISAFAEDQDIQQPKEPRDSQEQGRMNDHQGGMKGKMRMGMHRPPSMIATSDGGVLVLNGGKLAKYDAQLNLVKEVEIKGGPAPSKKEHPKMDEEQIPSPPDLPAEEAPKAPTKSDAPALATS